MKKMSTFNNVKIGLKDIAMLIVMVAAVVVLFVMSMVNYSRTYDTTISNAEESTIERAKQCAAELDSIFGKKFETLNYIASLPEINEMNWATQYNYLKDKAERLGFVHMFIMTEDGKGCYVKDNTVKDQSSEPFYRNVMNNETYITEPYLGSDQKIITICTSIYDGNKKVGSLCAVMDVDDIYKAVESMQGNTTAVVINSTGKYIAADDMSYVTRSLNIYDKVNEVSENKDFITEGIEKSENILGTLIIDGNEYYASMNPIKYGDWYIVVRVLKNDLIGNLQKILITQEASVVLLVLILASTSRFVYKITTREKIAFVDSLTSVNNRARCNIMLDKLDTNRREKVMIVNFDLNDFKEINDTYGHNVGDEALKHFAKLLNKSFGKNGFVGRMGGDEFVVILTGKDTDKYEELLQDFKDNVQSFNNSSSTKYKLSIAYGNAVRDANSEEKTISELYDEADRNMYFYKETFKKARAAKK